MSFESRAPEEVATVDFVFFEGLPVHANLAGLYYINGTGSEPAFLVGKDRLDRVPYLSDPRNFGMEISDEVTSEDFPSRLPHLLSLIDQDYRLQAGLDGETPTYHNAALRSGNGNLGFESSTVWLKLFPGYPRSHVRAGKPHTDFIINDDLGYALTRGDGSLYWDGRFESTNPHTRHTRPRRILASTFLLKKEVQLKTPCYKSRDGVMVRFDGTSVHQAPEIFQSEEDPRIFFRDVVSIIDPREY